MAERPIARVMLAAGVLQLASLLTPAAHMRIIGPIAFARVPNGGVALGILAAMTIAAALRPNGWWRWLPPTLSAVVLSIVYWRLVHAPSETFVDPVLRRTLHPSWGFVPMIASIALGLIGAALVRSAAPATRAARDASEPLSATGPTR